MRWNDESGVSALIRGERDSTGFVETSITFIGVDPEEALILRCYDRGRLDIGVISPNLPPPWPEGGYDVLYLTSNVSPEEEEFDFWSSGPSRGREAIMFSSDPERLLDDMDGSGTVEFFVYGVTRRSVFLVFDIRGVWETPAWKNLEHCEDAE
ncbi:MAG: hypothetical protein OXH07_04235 [Chloroflexi bacterium]|nr:hypothetical protein [Chloroflexota bacterium]